MTDSDLVEKKLAQIETYVSELGAARPELLDSDVRELRFVEHTLQMAIQAALDAASHVVSSERLGEPATNRALFEILARHGWVPEQLRESLQRMVGFRNLLVHGYAEVEPEIVREVLSSHVGDLLLYATTLRAALRRG